MALQRGLETCYTVCTMLRRLRAVCPPCVLVAAFVACASPTLPLPPPEAPAVQPGPDADHVKLVAGCGGAQANAVIVIVNRDLSVPNDAAVSGARTDACGAWDATVFAHSGDVLDITQEFGTTSSPPTPVQVR
jgi:hypothetical protein